jgi:hypothetical protein
VARGWRRLHTEELHNLYTSQNIVRVMKSSRIRRARHEARNGEMRNAHRIEDGKPEGKRPLERPTRGWDDNIIRVDLTEMGGMVRNGWIWLRMWTSGGFW